MLLSESFAGVLSSEFPHSGAQVSIIILRHAMYNSVHDPSHGYSELCEDEDHRKHLYLRLFNY